MDQLGLEDLEVDQRVDLLRTRTRGFNQRPQYYNSNLQNTLLLKSNSREMFSKYLSNESNF